MLKPTIEKVVQRCVDKKLSILSTDETRIVDVMVGTNRISNIFFKENIIEIAVVFKNKDKGEPQQTCNNCFMDSKFDYPCSHCNLQRWMPQP